MFFPAECVYECSNVLYNMLDESKEYKSIGLNCKIHKGKTVQSPLVFK